MFRFLWLSFVLGLVPISAFLPFAAASAEQAAIVRLPGLVGLRIPVQPAVSADWSRLVRQRYDFSCGSAALTTVLRFHLGEDLQEENVMEGMLRQGETERIAERRGFSLLDMKLYVESLGYRGLGFQADGVDDLRGLGRPVIVPVQYGGFEHFVVLRAIGDGRAFIGDPEYGNLTLTLGRFEQVWQPRVLFMVQPPGEESGQGLPPISTTDLRYFDVKRIQRGVIDLPTPIF